MERFPEEVRRFIAENIACVDQVEILAVLSGDRSREWRFPELATELRSEPQAVMAHVALLHTRGLVAIGTPGRDTTCRYGPRTPDLERAVGRLLDMYSQRPVSLIRLISART